MMLCKRKLNLKTRTRVDDKSSQSDRSIHTLGVKYLSDYLDRLGFAVLEVNNDPNHHFQLLVKINDKSLLIAVRTAHHPDAGTIDTSSLELLIRESEKLNVLPHFAGLSVIPQAKNNIKLDGSPGDQLYKVIFNGISAVRKSELHAANNLSNYQ